MLRPIAKLCSIFRRIAGALLAGILCALTVDAAHTLRVALIGAYSGSDAPNSIFFINGFKNFSVPYINTQKEGIPYYDDKMIIEIVEYDWQTNASLIATCVQNAHAGIDMQGNPVGEIHMIVAATAKANREIIEAAQALGIPNIHTSGGNPTMWKSENTFAFGMHLPFIWYTRGPLRLAQTVGLKRVAIIRSAAHGFSMASCIAAIQWAKESGLEIVGPSKAWCLDNQNRTGQCRVVMDRCVCGDQSDVDAFGFGYDLASSSTFYELDERLIGNGFVMKVVDNRTTDFVRFIVKDWRAQNKTPDIVLNFAMEYHNVLNAMKQEDFTPQMLIGWHGGNLPTWSVAQDDQGNNVLGQLEGLGAVGFGQWHIAMAFSDPVFGSNSEVVQLYADTYNGAALGYDEAGAIATGVVTYIAVSKYLDSGFRDLPLPAKRVALREAFGQLNDETMWGLVRFNRFNQNSGRGSAAWQVQVDSETPEFKQKCILPSDAAEATLALPFPSWGARLGCSSGSYNALTACKACQSGTFNGARTAGLLSLMARGIDAAQPTTCTRCEAGLGTLPNETGQTRCRTCPLGFAQDGSEMHRGICQPCRPGSYRDANVSGAECSLCHAETYSSTSGAIHCNPCPDGTFQMDRGQRACVCKIGFYKDPLDTEVFGSTRPCLPCDRIREGSTTQFPGASRAEQCDCGVGTFLYQGECKLCDDMFPKGSVHCQGFGEAPTLKKGHMNLEGKLKVFDCPGLGEGCLGGVPVGILGCAEGGSGTNCAKCDINWWYDHASGKCKACGNGVVGILLAVVTMAWIGVCLKLRPLEETFGEKTFVKTMRLSCVRIPIAQVLDLLQLFAILNQSAISWPRDTGSTMRGIGDVFDLSVLSLECFLGGEDKDGYAFRHVLFVNLMPAIFMLVAMLVSLPSFLIPGLGRLRPPSHRVATNLSLELLRTCFLTILNFAINLVFSKHIHTNGVETLAAFPHIRSTDSQMEDLNVVAVCALAMWCVGSLSLILALLYVVPRMRNKQVWCQYTLVLFVPYADDKGYRIAVDMVLKMCVVISISIFDTPDAQMQWIAIAYLLYLMLVAFTQPYRYKRYWLSDIILTVCKVAILIFSSTTFLSDDQYNTGMTVSIAIAAVVAFFFLVWALFNFFQGGADEPARDDEVFESIHVWLHSLLPDPIHLHDLVPGTRISENLSQATAQRRRTTNRSSLEVPDMCSESCVEIIDESECSQCDFKEPSASKRSSALPDANDVSDSKIIAAEAIQQAKEQIVKDLQFLFESSSCSRACALQGDQQSMVLEKLDHIIARLPPLSVDGTRAGMAWESGSEAELRMRASVGRTPVWV